LCLLILTMRYSVLSVGLLAGAADAWLPHERELPAFNMSARYDQLGKRWDPKLPSGITKIRGVNFGGWLISEPWMMCHEWTAVRVFFFSFFHLMSRCSPC